MSLRSVLGIFLALFLLGCTKDEPRPPLSFDSVAPGTSVRRGEAELKLMGTPLSVGKSLPSVPLVDAVTMKDVDLSKETGKVLFLSLVPSIDTKVCEAQTHYLGEEGDKIAGRVERITVSRDTPFAQKRFAEEAKLTDIRYLSDYKAGDFGRANGLLVSNLMLLARSVILVDKAGVVRYIQVVPEITHLPDMEKAFSIAVQLSEEK